MNPILTVLLLALIGLLGAQLGFAQRQVPLGPRIFIAIGGPFLFLGFVLGPHLTRILSYQTVDLLTPLVALGLGWIALLFGLQLDLDHLRQFPLRYLALAWLQAAVALGIVFSIAYLVTDAWYELEFRGVLLAAAATACVSTPAAIALISNTYGARGPVTRLLFYVASLDAAVGIVALGLTHAAHHTDVLEIGVAFSLFEWFLFSILLGVFFGILFLSLTRIRPRTQELMLLLLGLVLFAAGTAFYLRLSPLFVCMITGVVIGNLSPLRRRVYVALSEWEKPIYIMMLVLAGALLQFPTWWILPLVAAYVAARILAKWAGGLLASRLHSEEIHVPASFGLALTPQGGLSLAMAISFILIYVPTGPELDVFFATVVIAVGISDLIGPFLVRGVLASAGEFDQAPAPATAAADRQSRRNRRVERILWLEITIQVVGVVAILVLGVGMILLARAIFRVTRSLSKVDDALTTIGHDARPVLDRMRAIGENLNFMVMSVRRELDRVSDTISLANERLEDALESADDRVQELGALIDVVQGEVEDTLLSATSTLRGIRTGAKLLRRRRNDDDDSEAELADE